MTSSWVGDDRRVSGVCLWVGYALAVMYSIYSGGYRAAIKDSKLADPPERFLKAMARLKIEHPYTNSRRT